MFVHRITGELIHGVDDIPEGDESYYEELDLEEKSYYLGVDMGKEGALVLIPINRNNRIFVFKMPLVKSGGVDEDELFNYLTNWSPYVIHCVTEKLQAIYQSSSKAMFNFGKTVGLTLAVLKIAGVPFTELKPSIWQKEMFLGEPETLDTKTRSVMVSKKLFPGLILSKFTKTKRVLKDDSNITDALLMAEYARRKNL